LDSIISNINKTFESRVRLGIMSVLTVQQKADFNYLKDILNVTDGNLASHLRALENEGFISINKRFVGRKTQTTYYATNEGREAFRSHLDALERLIKEQKS
jgi:DNA-binding PadR family transcriptional regulator